MLMLLAPPTLQAPPPGPPQGQGQGRPEGRPPHGLPLLRFAQDLGLSEAQVQKLQAVEQAHRDAMERKMLAFHQAQRALHEGIHKPWLSTQEVDGLQRAASAKEAELIAEARQANAEGWQVLTPEQQAKAKVLLARAPMEGRPGGGPGGPHGGRGMGRPGPPPQGPGGGPEEGPDDGEA